MQNLLTLAILFSISLTAEAASFGNQSSSDDSGTSNFGNTVATWHKVYGQGGFSSVEDLLKSNQGGYLTAGGIGRNNALQWVGAADQQIQVTKIDQGGANIWVKSYTPFGVGVPGKVKQVLEDSSNNIIVAGNVGSYGTKNRKETRDVFVMKLDSLGNKIWARKYGGPEANTIGSLAIADDGGILVLGSKGDRKETQAWLFKVTADGEFLGESIFPQRVTSSLIIEEDKMLLGGTGLLIVDNQGNAIDYKNNYPGGLSKLQPVADGYIVTGGVRNVKKKQYPHWMGKIDRNGEIVWQKTYKFKGQQLSYLNSMVITDDAIYAVGAQNQEIGYDLEPFVVKTDLEGNQLWKKAVQKSKRGTTRMTKLVATADGGFLASGVTGEDFTYDTSPVRVYGKALLLKFDAEGNSDYLIEEKPKKRKLW